MNKNPAVQKETPTSIALFRIFVVLLLVSVGAMAAIIGLNSTVATVTGKVVSRSTETAFASRKSSYQEDVVEVSYTINGVERVGKSPVPHHGGSGNFVPVHYYPMLPMFPWFYTRTNAALLTSILAILFSLSGGALSWYSASKHWKAEKARLAKAKA